MITQAFEVQQLRQEEVTHLGPLREKCVVLLDRSFSALKGAGVAMHVPLS